MTADRLLRLYPRAWRERYGEEFIATVGTGALHLQQIIDIVAGAVDAHLSSEVRRQSRDGHSTQGGHDMLKTMKASCGSTQLRFSNRDSLISAAALIGGTVLLLAIGILLQRRGMPVIGEAIKGIAFPVSIMFSMLFTFLKGQPRRVQIVIVGGTTAVLTLISFLAALT